MAANLRFESIDFFCDVKSLKQRLALRRAVFGTERCRELGHHPSNLSPSCMTESSNFIFSLRPSRGRRLLQDMKVSQNLQSEFTLDIMG